MADVIASRVGTRRAAAVLEKRERGEGESSGQHYPDIRSERCVAVDTPKSRRCPLLL